MKKILLFILLFSIKQINAQQGRLPTTEELDIKYKLEKLYLNADKSTQPNHLMTTGPEQDCAGAIRVCQQNYVQNITYTGYGATQEVNGTCLLSSETNSVWYIFTIQNSGTFTFLLNTPNDYDFALYDITTTGCSGVPTATPVRCNYSATYGNTGLTLPASTITPISVAANGIPTEPGLNVTTGQTFALIIDNYSANTNGYTLTFGGTAQVFDNTPPTITSSNYICYSQNITLNFSTLIQCSSLNTSGNQFTILGPSSTNVPVLALAGNGCSSGSSTCTSATLTFASPLLPTGTYTISTPGNQITDICGNLLPAQSITFQYVAQGFGNGALSISPSNTIICAGAPTTLTASGAATYTWSANAANANTNTVVVNPYADTTYRVVGVTAAGCYDTANASISIKPLPTVSYTLTQDVAPQTWDLYPTYPNNMTSVSWNWGDATPPSTILYPSHIYAQAGKYNICVTATDSSGCSNSFCLNDSIYRLSNNNVLNNMVYVNVFMNNQTTNISTVNKQSNIKIYPNPAGNKITIDASDVVEVKLFDALGKQITNGKQNQLDVSTVNDGVYFIQVKTNSSTSTQKIVVQH